MVTGSKGALIIDFVSDRYFAATALAGNRFLEARKKKCAGKIQNINNAITQRIKGLIQRNILETGGRKYNQSHHSEINKNPWKKQSTLQIEENDYLEQ
jgi:hypothetical protein